MAHKTIIPVSLDTEVDKDILTWLDRQENRSAAIRAAIRDHLGRGGVTLGDVYQAIKELERKIGQGGVSTRVLSDAGEDLEEPAEAAAALDALAAL